MTKNNAKVQVTDLTNFNEDPEFIKEVIDLTKQNDPQLIKKIIGFKKR